MAGAYGFPFLSAQGVVFVLDDKARRDRQQQFGDWTIEVRKDVAFVCARTTERDVIAELPQLANLLLFTEGVEGAHLVQRIKANLPTNAS
ncbi:MAG: hypothetical protein LC114_25045 [Bryobacterales bacterium]|jgi:hypothetical protein|nr:hypothetical protein [Bryobacterales bacterium]